MAPASTAFRVVLVALVLMSCVLAQPSPRELHQLNKRVSNGQILLPPNGTAIAPGEVFDFNFLERTGRYDSTVDYSVWLLTSEPGSPENLVTQLIGSNGQLTGYYFGHFNRNNAPANLTMPNFTLAPFYARPVSDYRVYLGVLEQIARSDGSIGYHLSLAANYLIYNATSPVTSPLLCPVPTTVATGSCGCEFTNYCEAEIEDPNEPGDWVSGNFASTEEECRNLCDSTPQCNSYTFPKPPSAYCILSSDVGQYISPRANTNAGTIDRACKDRCRAANATANQPPVYPVATYYSAT